MRRPSGIIVLVVLLIARGALAGFEASDPAPDLKASPLGETKPWEISIRGFFGHNDNVQTVPDQSPFYVGDTRSSYVGVDFTGSYRLVNDERWLVAAAIDFSHTWNLSKDRSSPGADDDASDYDLSVLSPALRIEHRTRIAGLPVAPFFTYNYRQEWLDDVEAGGLRSNTLGLGVRIVPMNDLAVTVVYNHSFDQFDIEFPGPPFDRNDRDAQRDSISLSGQYWWDQGLRSVTITYAFAHNESEGRNWEYDSHSVTARLESHVYGPVWAAGSFSYAHYDYPYGYQTTFAFGDRSEQHIFNYGAQVIYKINANWSVDVFVDHRVLESDDPLFEGETTNIGGGVTFRY